MAGGAGYLAVSAIITGISTYYSMEAQGDAADRQATLYGMKADAQQQRGVDRQFEADSRAARREIEAENVREQAGSRADRIREQARSFRARQAATAANQGVMVNSGSASALRDRTNYLAERDALVAISAGNEKALYMEENASDLREAGENTMDQQSANARSSSFSAWAAQEAGQDKQVGTLLSGASDIAGSMYQYDKMQPSG